MGNNKKELAKQRSFIYKLTKSQIVDLLKECGLVLNTNIYSEYDGKLLPAIEKGYNKENDTWEIFIRCKTTDKYLNDINNMVASFMPSFFTSKYSMLDSMVVLTDYSLHELTICGDEERAINLQNVFANFMYKQFGEDYRTSYNEYITKLMEENEQAESPEEF